MIVAPDVLGLIGNTPLVRLKRASELTGCEILGKAEFLNVGGSGVFNSMFRSMRRINATEAGSLKPRKLSVVTVKAGDTIQSLSARMAYRDAPAERFLVLNGLRSDSRLTPGQKVKLVTY
jgi:predicted Zn-dependent protease